MLDASACGLPIVVSDRIRAPHRVEDSGVTYREPDVDSLGEALLRLGDPDVRAEMGRVGAHRMAQELSWDQVATRRAADYERSLAERKGSQA